MNIIVAPDSFKGSLSAVEAGSMIQKAFLTVFPHAVIDVYPMADGGEGTLETLMYSTKGKRYELEVTGPLGSRVLSEYGVLGDGKTVVIEIAKIAGLPMIPNEKRNPMNTTTYGIGEVIKDAVNKGYREFIIGLGGSATNDGGLGLLQALGVTFLDASGDTVEPFGSSVGQVAKVDFQTIATFVKDCTFQIASDVENPLCGDNGATAVFGPQKGATSAIIKELDTGLKCYANLIEAHLLGRFQHIQGAGAAGGLGFAFLTIGGEITSGAKLVAEAIGLQDKMATADIVITGEGQSDYQTLLGKVPSYIGRLAVTNNVKAFLISGSLGQGYEDLYEYFISCDSIVTGPMALHECMDNAQELLFKKSINLARILIS